MTRFFKKAFSHNYCEKCIENLESYNTCEFLCISTFLDFWTSKCTKDDISFLSSLKIHDT